MNTEKPLPKGETESGYRRTANITVGQRMIAERFMNRKSRRAIDAQRRKAKAKKNG